MRGDWPYLWVDATYVKVRQAGRIVSVAVIVAVGVNADGRREVLGIDIGPSEAETFWTTFLRKLARRGLRGVKLVVSDAHEGIKAAVSRIFTATWQRCRVGPLKNWPTAGSMPLRARPVAKRRSRCASAIHGLMMGSVVRPGAQEAQKERRPAV
jgi:transposase-like protein